MRIISKHEMIEAFSLRASYAAGKIKLNVGKKFEGRWREVKAQSESVIQWLQSEECAGNEQVTVFAENAEAEAQMVEDDTIAEELEPTEHAPTEHAPTEHAPTDDEDGVRESLIKAFDAVATDKDVGGKTEEQVTGKLDGAESEEWAEIERMVKVEDRIRAEIVAEESAKAADDVCAMVEATKTGEPIPEHDYIFDPDTGLETYRGPLHAGTDQLPILFSDEIYTAFWDMRRESPDEWTWCNTFRITWRDDPLKHLVAKIITCAVEAVSISSNGWRKVCQEIDLSKIFVDGPMAEELGSITAIRNGEKTKLTLTREMVFNNYFVGSGCAVSRHIEDARALLEHVKGLRCLHAYKHADRAAIVPCIECMKEDTCYIETNRRLICNNGACCAAVCTDDYDPAKRRQALAERIRKHRKLKD